MTAKVLFKNNYHDISAFALNTRQLTANMQRLSPIVNNCHVLIPSEINSLYHILFIHGNTSKKPWHKL